MKHQAWPSHLSTRGPGNDLHDNRHLLETKDTQGAALVLLIHTGLHKGGLGQVVGITRYLSIVVLLSVQVHVPDCPC